MGSVGLWNHRHTHTQTHRHTHRQTDRLHIYRVDGNEGVSFRPDSVRNEAEAYISGVYRPIFAKFESWGDPPLASVIPGA